MSRSSVLGKSRPSTAPICATSRAEPIQARGERLLQRWWNGLNAALLASLQKQPCHLLDEQRHAAGSLAHPLNHVLG
jgi:hypothetical protein